MAIQKPAFKLLETLPEDLDMDAYESDTEIGSDEDVKLIEPSKNAIYNKEAILDKLGDISWPKDVNWLYKLSLDVDQDQKVDVNDDLARELAFYTQALEGTRQALLEFQTLSLPFFRPTDYCADMVKTDTHMEKIKGRLLSKKRIIEEMEERRKARENKKKAKEVQAEKQKERAKMKKEEIESVKKWRKQRKQSGFADSDKDGDMGLSFENGKELDKSKTNKRAGVNPWDRSGGKAEVDGGKDRKGGNNKRKNRDSKYGFGGKKGMNKQNTAETINDFKSFNKSASFGNKKRKK